MYSTNDYILIFHVQWHCTYQDRLGPSGKVVEKSAKLMYLDITGNRIRYSVVLWLPELNKWGVVERFRRSYIL
jgi:hypothetical protein